MEYVKETLPGLWGGVSQQTPAVRLQTQCTAQENMINDPVSGITRRPPFIDTGVSISAPCKLHKISKDNEKYLVVFSNTETPVTVINMVTKEQALVEYGKLNDSGDFVADETVRDYFTGLTDVQKDIKCITVHDNTFVVNTTRVTGMTGDVTSEINKNEVFVTVDSWYAKTFDITVGDKTITVTPDDGYNTTIDEIAELVRETLVTTDWENEVSFTYTGDYSGAWNTGSNEYAGTYTANLVGMTEGTAELVIASDSTFTYKSFNTEGVLKDTITGTVVDGNTLQSSWDGFIGDLRTDDSGDYYWNIVYYDSDGYIAGAAFMVSQLSSSFNINVTTAGEITGLINTNWNVGGTVSATGLVDMISVNAPETYIFQGQIGSDFKITGTWHIQNGNASGNWSGVRTSSPSTSTVFSAERKGAVVRVLYSGTAIEGGLTLHGLIQITGGGIKVRAGTVPTFQDLWPASYWSGVKMQVLQDNYGQTEGYYVYSDGVNWVESTGYGVKTTIDASTMPHRILRWSDGSFKITTCPWSERLAADENAAPLPSFTGKTLNNIFFHQNRLSVITDNTIVMSRSGDYFNFFPKTALEVLDDDPIDIGVGSIKTSRLLEALPFNKQIILRGEASQHLLSYSGSYLSPMTAALDITTIFPTYSHSVSGIAGSNLYFLTPVNQYAQVKEYFIQPDTYLEDAADITRQIPQYITADPELASKILSCPEKDMLFVFTDLGTTSVFFVYNYLWKGDSKPVSAWNTWRLPEDYTLIDAEIIGTVLYFVITNGTQTLLAEIDLSCNPENFLDLGTIDTPAFIILSPWYLRNDKNNPVMNSLQLRKILITLNPTAYNVDSQFRNHQVSEDEIVDTFFVLKGDAHNTNIKITSTGGHPLNLKTITYEGFTSNKPRFLK